MKKNVIALLALAAMLIPVCCAGTGFAYGEPDPGLGNGEYELEDYRIYKTHIGGEYICDGNAGLSFELGDGLAVMSDALYESQGIAGGFRDQWAMLQSFKGLTWLSFVTSYSADGGGGFTDWKEFNLYTSDIGELEVFYVEGDDKSVLPWERQAYKKTPGSMPQIPLEERMSFDAGLLGGDDGVSLSAGQVFPNMGDCLYKLEIEKAVGDEVTGYRDDDGVPHAGFGHKGFWFEYRLSGDSYDVFPDTNLTITAMGE